MNARFTDDYLLYLLAQASDAVSASFHQALAQQGIAVSTWRILASLHPDHALGIGALAEACLTKQPTMTRMIDRVEAEGLIQRQTPSGDRRQVSVRLTQKGRALAGALTEQAKAHEADALSSYSDAQIAALKAALRNLKASASQVKAGNHPRPAQ